MLNADEVTCSLSSRIYLSAATIDLVGKAGKKIPNCEFPGVLGRKRNVDKALW